MLSIQIKKKKVKDEDGKKSDEEYLVVNNIPDLDSYYFGNSVLTARFYSDEVVEILLNHSFNEVGKSLSKFTYEVDVEWWDNSFDLDIYCNEYFDLKIPSVPAI
jgi:hypothetical protein